MHEEKIQEYLSYNLSTPLVFIKCVANPYDYDFKILFDDGPINIEYENLGDLILKILKLARINFSTSEKLLEKLRIETNPGKWRSSIDIYRHVLYFTTEYSLIDVMKELWNLRDYLVSHYCPDVERRVFALREYKSNSTFHRIRAFNRVDEYGIYDMAEWGELNNVLS